MSTLLQVAPHSVTIHSIAAKIARIKFERLFKGQPLDQDEKNEFYEVFIAGICEGLEASDNIQLYVN